MKRFLTAVGVSVVGAVVMVPFAFAAPGDPPTFDASTLTPKLNDYAVALLAGMVILIGAALVIRVPFTIVRVALSAVKKLFGGSRPTAA